VHAHSTRRKVGLRRWIFTSLTAQWAALGARLARLAVDTTGELHLWPIAQYTGANSSPLFTDEGGIWGSVWSVCSKP